MAVTYKINQIATLVDSLYNQSIGKTSLTAVDASGLVSMGDTVLSSATNKDSFFKALVDRIGKVVVDVEQYIPKKRAIYKNSIEFGNALQMMIFEAGTSSIDQGWAGVNAWNGSTRQSQSNPFDVAPNTTAKQYLFSQKAGWSYKDVIPDFQLKSAFVNLDNMAAFISGLYMAKANKLALDVENTGNIAVCYAAFQTLNKTGSQLVNALYRYNIEVLGLSAPTTDGSTITYPDGWLMKAKALTDKAFLRYFSQQLSLINGRMHTFTQAFNKDEHPYAATDVAIEVLSHVASACKYSLESDTYHNDLVALPDYSEQAYWFASGNDFDFESCSAMSGVNGKFINGVSAILYDKKAVMVTVEDYRSHTLYNPDDEVTNTFDKCNIAYAVCPAKDFVAVQIADPIIVQGAVYEWDYTAS